MIRKIRPLYNKDGAPRYSSGDSWARCPDNLLAYPCPFGKNTKRASLYCTFRLDIGKLSASSLSSSIQVQKKSLHGVDSAMAVVYPLCRDRIAKTLQQNEKASTEQRSCKVRQCLPYTGNCASSYDACDDRLLKSQRVLSSHVT